MNFSDRDLNYLEYIKDHCFDEYTDWLDTEWYWTADYLVEKYGKDAIYNFFKEPLSTASLEEKATLIPYLCFLGVDNYVPDLLKLLDEKIPIRAVLDSYGALICLGRKEYTDKFLETRDFWINKGWGKFHEEHIYPILRKKLAHDPEYLKQLIA